MVSVMRVSHDHLVRQTGVPLAEYVRAMVHDHILQRGAGFRESGAGLRALVRAGKAWVIAYHRCVALAAGLPGKERRAELERLTWEAVKKAHEFIQTEEAAKNAKHRILALQAVALITRAEEQILADMDKAEVDQPDSATHRGGVKCHGQGCSTGSCENCSRQVEGPRRPR